MAATPRHTVIVGSGIVGACSAYYLSRRSHPVTLLDQDLPRASASAGNAGIVALGHPPLPRPGLAGKALRWMFEPASPLYIPPRFDLGMLTWFWRFWRACDEKKLHSSMHTLVALGSPTMACWEEILTQEEIACHWRREGWLDVYRTENGRRLAEADAKIIAGHGLRVDRLSRTQLRDHEPAFGERVLGAVVYPESAFLDPGLFLRGLLKVLAARGVTLRVGVAAGSSPPSRDAADSPGQSGTPLPGATTVGGVQSGARVRRVLVREGVCRGVELEDGEQIEADRVVLAAGAWTPRLAAGVGVQVPLQAGKGYHLDLASLDPPLRTACVLTESYVAVTPMGDSLRLAGTLEFSGINHNLIRRRMDMLQKGAAICLPGVADAPVLSRWCGLRPCTADGLPVVGWAPRIAGLFIATGHAKMGLTLGPITGKLVSECILEGNPSLPIEALTTHRF